MIDNNERIYKQMQEMWCIEQQRNETEIARQRGEASCTEIGNETRHPVMKRRGRGLQRTTMVLTGKSAPWVNDIKSLYQQQRIEWNRTRMNEAQWMKM